MDGALLQVFVYLAAAVIMAPLAIRLGLGSVLGYLIAGLVVGPYALNLVGAVEDVQRAAEYGVVILLFLIGLEVRPALLWSMRGAIFGAGAAQIVGTGAVLGGAALAFGLGWREAVAVGLILAMSSTAIVLQMLEERGLRRGPVGRSAFGMLLFQDLSIIPLLALLPLLASGAVAAHGAEGGHHGASLISDLPAWAQTLSVLGAVAVVILGGRFLIRPVFRAIAGARLREIFTAAALMLVVGVTLLMQLVGLSPALGAFLAGVVLAESEFRRELETDIEPFRGLLLGLFFITVGAGLNVPLVLDRPLQLAGLFIGLMALKALVIFVILRTARLAWRDAGAAGVALSQGGEFAFVLFGIAVGEGVLRPETTSLLIAAVALSMAATPLALAGWQRLTRTRVRSDRPEYDTDFGDGEPDAIVAGFGRFGQVVGRVLLANGFRTAVLENSVEQIELLRRFNRRVYYGDARRLDLLRAAGAEKAKILVIAIDDREKSAELVEAVREAFPNLKVLARAYDRRHAYDLLNKGAHVTERETFEGGLAMAAEALKALGWRAYKAERAARLFRRHDERQFDELRPLWGDTEKFTVAARESSPRMEDLMRSDLALLDGEAEEDGWDVASLYEETRRRAEAEDAPEAVRGV
jgi:monovalent cation:proton antiporter-2 (CPA2) family protein